MKRSKKVTIGIIIFFIIVATVIGGRTAMGIYFKKKFGKRPPPGVIVEIVAEKNFNQTILDNLQDELKGIGISKIDYCEVRNEDDLNLSKMKQRSRLFLAFYINKIRVIDNFILY